MAGDYIRMSSTLLQALWGLVRRPLRRRNADGFAKLTQKAIRDRYMGLPDLEDLLSYCGVDWGGNEAPVDDLAIIFGLAVVATYPRPRRTSSVALGLPGLQLADVAVFLIVLERMGFDVDAGPIAAPVVEHVARETMLSDSELEALWYARNKDRRAPLQVVCPDDPPAMIEETLVKYRTARGYKLALCTAGAGGAPRHLTVNAPHYRRRPAPVEVECKDCGYQWTRGDVESSAGHRRFHREQMRLLAPTPHSKLLAARTTHGEEPTLVMPTSAVWKHREMYERARLFRRELRYSFVQWEAPRSRAKRDPDAQGQLLDLPDGRIVGACSFRRIAGRHGLAWKLDWIWVAPRFRRGGVLTRRWPAFRARYGDFEIEHPVSVSMREFLAKTGDEAMLLRDVLAADED
jgi:hypothetical protein